MKPNLQCQLRKKVIKGIIIKKKNFKKINSYPEKDCKTYSDVEKIIDKNINEIRVAIEYHGKTYRMCNNQFDKNRSLDKKENRKKKRNMLDGFLGRIKDGTIIASKKGSIFLFKFIGGKEEKNTITNHYGLKAATKKIHGLGKTELENFSTILYFDECQLNLRRGDNNKNSNLKPYVQTREFLFSILEDSIILFNEEEINELKKRIDESFPELKENSKRENEDRENEDRDNQERASKKLKCETKKNPWNTKGILKSMNSVNNQINPEYASSDQSILIENHNTCSGDLDFTTTRDSNRVSIYDFLKGPNDLPFFEVSPHDPKVPFKFPLFEN